jgi:alpha-1,6-mannosyltransferase
VIIFQAIYSPYTKVEETFQVNNMYDFNHHHVNVKAYDYHEFPGVVPRTFINSAFTVSQAKMPLEIYRFIF